MAEAAPSPAGPARRRALQALSRVERGRARRLEQELRLDGLGPADRALAVELTRGVERMRLLLDFVLAALCERRWPPPDPYVLTTLRLGAYQLLFLPRIPPRAAVHATVALLDRRGGFANAVLRRLGAGVVERPARVGELDLPAGTGPRALALELPWPDPATEPAALCALQTGLPRFLVERWFARHGEAAARTAALASASAPSTFLRVNRRRGGAAEVQARLAAEGAEAEPTDHPAILRWRRAGRRGPVPAATRAFAEGWFSIQDPTALRAAEAVAVEPGWTVVDLCAAPGGKATALAEVLGGGGVVCAHDADPGRLRLVAEGARRLGLEDRLRVVPRAEDLPSDADLVLADVPCSNTGVLARRVEVRRRLGAAAIAGLAGVQGRLLRRALSLARPGGRVVYSTCSLEDEENRAVVEAAVAEGGARLLASRLTLPEAGSRDGGYHAVLEREML